MTSASFSIEEESIFFSGDFIEGTVSLKVNPEKPLTKVKAVAVQIIGFLYVSWEKRGGRHAQFATDKFLKVEQLVIGDMRKRKESKKLYQLNPGNHTFNFRLQLPSTCYPSCKRMFHDGWSELTYKLELAIATSRFKKIKHPLKIIVGGFQEERPIVLSKFLEKPETFSHDESYIGDKGLLKMNVQMPGTGFVVGDNVSIGFDIDNTTKQDVVKVSFSVHTECMRKIGARVETCSIGSERVEFDFNCSSGEKKSGRESFKIPKLDNATMKHKNLEYKKYIQVRAVVAAKLRTDLVLNVPVFLALAKPKLKGEENVDLSWTMQHNNNSNNNNNNNNNEIKYQPAILAENNSSGDVHGRNGLPIDPEKIILWQEEAKKCACCDCAFKLLKPAHHCRYCGNAVCKSCSQKHVVDWVGTKPQRVCSRCMKESDYVKSFVQSVKK